MTNNHRLTASFRDPSGFLFSRQGTLYRQINHVYRENYRALMDSGLYGELVDAKLLVPHEEVSIEPEDPSAAYLVLQPETVQFISYPYEWSFSQLKDAALTTITIQKHALKYGLSLKDCSAYNIQFHNGRPTLIDTLSFEIYHEGEPWVAYRQFCQHFLSPLALMAYRDVRLGLLLRIYIDGIPLDLASRLLPAHTRLRFSLLSHIHLHAASQRHYADKAIDKSTVTRRMSETALQGLVDSLESGVRGLSWKLAETEWGDYYQATHNYSSQAIDHKKKLVEQFLDQINPRSVWDLGANTGLFSRLASSRGISTLAFDIDPSAVEQNYRRCVSEGATQLLPLVLDLTNPSPGLGWHNQERMSLLERATPDAAIALALVHHLAISNNVPLDLLARFFSQLAPWLVVEFVPKSDEQVQRLLATREDIFPNYNFEGFEAAFSSYYAIHAATQIQGSERKLYLMERLQDA
jgi:hypothetical protein